jgi:putative spermidine/putrescine transport system permease protein
VTAQTIAVPPPARASGAGALQRLSTWLYRHPRLALAILLAPPLAWLGIVYLGSLLALLAQSFFYLDGFTGLIVREFTLRTYAELFTGSNLDIILRTTVMATVVTLACALIGFPIATTWRAMRGRA